MIAPFLATWGPSGPVPAVWEELPSEIYGSLERGADLASRLQALCRGRYSATPE